MRRCVLNYLIDAAAMLLMLILLATGLVVRYILPPGSGGRGGGGMTLWGLGRHDWGGLHFWLAAALIALVVFHLSLHWGWVCASTRRLFAPRAAGAVTTRRMKIGSGLLVFLIAAGLTGIFVWVASGDARSMLPASPKAPEASPQPGHDELVRGSMTLREAALAGSMAPEALRDALVLPESVLDERIGRLGRRFGFDMSDVRRALRVQDVPPAAAGQ